jgi:hypothetical protein
MATYIITTTFTIITITIMAVVRQILRGTWLLRQRSWLHTQKGLSRRL